MKHRTHWVLALLTLVSVASLSGAWTTPQEPPPQEKRPGGMASRPAKARADKLSALKKIVPTLKMTLAESIGLAEKETTGKAVAAGLEVMGGKALFQVTVLLNDELRTANVNTETRKVVLLAPKDEEVSGRKAKVGGEDKGGAEDGADDSEDGGK